MEHDILLPILLQLILISLNAVFACAEIAVISMNDNKLAQLVSQGDKRALRLARLTSRPAQFLATIQIAITLSGFLGSAFAADNFSDRLTGLLLAAGVPLPAATLDTLHAVKTRFGGTTILGVSNISFGLPQRELITAAFFTMAMERGLSAAIMNPNATEMMKAYTCFCTLRGFDPNCTGYIDFALQYQQEAEAAKAAQPQGAGSATTGAATATDKATAGGDCIIAPDGTPLQKGTLQYAVVRGLKPEAHQYTAALLDTTQPLDIINQHLIPALDIVGKGFETKKLFLPQLLMSAEAAKEAFSVIKEQMIRTGTKGESKGTVVLATVKGDIHDIGKNIVKVLMENYSFTVIDLGRDVPPEKVLETVQEHDIRLVGLSALMTTTVPSMEATIKLLREKAPGCTVCVGGAVMTREYADMIGADFYGKDALETVRFAQEFFS